MLTGLKSNSTRSYSISDPVEVFWYQDQILLNFTGNKSFKYHLGNSNKSTWVKVPFLVQSL